AQAEERSALMACSALSNYLKFGVVSNAANFPDMTVMPRAGFPMRLTIPHRNVPGQLQVIIDTVTKAGANIGPQHNDVKNGIGYCVVDLQQPIDESRVERIRSQKNILGVRTFRF
ncbi:hypothetical protein K8R03_01390, partial [Candidatus Kaiserbacteria bacterium]|nr:hypothetical protein [Candidatus Kaiserbacteria bacterium]